MYKVGLTGGIGCGKSTVANMFANLGVTVIDADETARDLVKPGSPALNDIAHDFGPDVLAPDGSLDRARLRQIIFSDPAQRQRLEAILHPRIIARMHERAAQAIGAYCVLVMPLLLEAGQRQAVDRIVVVDCDSDLQRRRATARDGMSATEFERILAAQLSREERVAAADDVIVNDADLQHLETQVRNLHMRYERLAGA